MFCPADLTNKNLRLVSDYLDFQFLVVTDELYWVVK